MTLRIDGLGIATPACQIEQSDAALLATRLSAVTETRARGMETLYRRTGVSTRHSVLLQADASGLVAQTFYEPAVAAADFGPTTATRMRRYEADANQLALSAARDALQEAECLSQDITHLVTVSCSGFTAPGFDLALIRELGLPVGTQRTHVGFMGCHGAINGLRVAQALAESQPGAVVLVCAVELCSLHHQYHAAADQLVANALFADGAAAIVGRAAISNSANERDPRQRLPSNDESTRSSWSLCKTGSAVIPQTEDFMSWRIRDHGFEMTLSPRVPEIIERELRPWLECWLAASELTLTDIPNWAIHPGGPRVVQACGQTLGLSTEQLAPSFGVLADYGNMSSPTVLFILDRLRRQRAEGACVILAFGPGLTIEAALLTANV